MHLLSELTVTNNSVEAFHINSVDLSPFMERASPTYILTHVTSRTKKYFEVHYGVKQVKNKADRPPFFLTRFARKIETVLRKS